MLLHKQGFDYYNKQFTAIYLQIVNHEGMTDAPQVLLTCANQFSSLHDQLKEDLKNILTQMRKEENEIIQIHRHLQNKDLRQKAFVTLHDLYHAFRKLDENIATMKRYFDDILRNTSSDIIKKRHISLANVGDAIKNTLVDIHALSHTLGQIVLAEKEQLQQELAFIQHANDNLSAMQKNILSWV